MVRRLLRREDVLWISERARRVHEAWLNRAMKEPERWTRIPVKTVWECGRDVRIHTSPAASWEGFTWDGVLVESDED